MITGSVTLGSAEAGLIVQTPVAPAQPAPAMLKAIVSMTPTLALESVIACRRDPAPPSAVVVTVRVAPRAPEVRAVNRETRAVDRRRPGRTKRMYSDLSDQWWRGERRDYIPGQADRRALSSQSEEPPARARGSSSSVARRRRPSAIAAR